MDVRVSRGSGFSLSLAFVSIVRGSSSSFSLVHHTQSKDAPELATYAYKPLVPLQTHENYNYYSYCYYYWHNYDYCCCR
uniref:Secreted protein n=1 Tax=Trichogramma kaykai TaxID=54128 RepID=A0ABD2WHT4_9HYME